MVSAASEGTIVIEGRYNGPPNSANGGYACGTVANLLGGGPAEVALRAPPPLDRPLEVSESEGVVSLRDGETVVAEGRSIDGLELAVPESLDRESGAAAAANYPWFEEHIFPTCFVCGPERAEGDGLRVFTGRSGEAPLGGGGDGSLGGGGDGSLGGGGDTPTDPLERIPLFGSTWTPAIDLADGDGCVRPEIVWAALDCPTAIAALTNGETVPGMLGTLAASIDAPLVAGELHTITAWGLGSDGRKRSAAAAIAGPDGRIKARSLALWIELKR